MISKKQLNYYSSLLKKKFRSEEKKILVEGKKNISEGLLNPEWRKNLEIIFATNEFLENEKEWVENFFDKKTAAAKITALKNSEVKKLSDTVSPQGITAVFRQEKRDKQISGRQLVLLDNISDPGNLGTIIRNCDWFGVHEIILGAGCTDIFNPKTIRASAGSIFHVDFFYKEDTMGVISVLKQSGYEVITADLNGENIYTFIKPEKFVLIFSNEANGPSGRVLEMTDKIISIPKKGLAESLNVSSASAVILSELFKH